MNIFTRHSSNPILSPNPNNKWESRAVFNPAAIEIHNRVILLYRAVGQNKNYVSQIGIAESDDGVEFIRQAQPWLTPETIEDCWGVEDPRATCIDGVVYITYTAISQPVKETIKHKRAKPLIPQVNLVTTNDFSIYSHQGSITPAQSDNKDVVLFSEKIRGCYVMLHRPSRWSRSWVDSVSASDASTVPFSRNSLPNVPGIWISYSYDLEHWFDHRLLFAPTNERDEKIGAGAPPIKTKDGWLLIYHHVRIDREGNRIYSARAVLLDSKNPSHIIAVSDGDVLIPEEDYECTGDVDRVVFPTGAFIRDDVIYMYYGAADMHCALATAHYTDLRATLQSVIE